MTTINVQFSDSTNAAIVSYFSAPQDPVDFPNQAQILTSDPRWNTFYDSLPVSMSAALPAPSAT